MSHLRITDPNDYVVHVFDEHHTSSGEDGFARLRVTAPYAAAADGYEADLNPEHAGKIADLLHEYAARHGRYPAPGLLATRWQLPPADVLAVLVERAVLDDVLRPDVATAENLQRYQESLAEAARIVDVLPALLALLEQLNTTVITVIEDDGERPDEAGDQRVTYLTAEDMDADAVFVGPANDAMLARIIDKRGALEVVAKVLEQMSEEERAQVLRLVLVGPDVATLLTDGATVATASRADAVTVNRQLLRLVIDHVNQGGGPQDVTSAAALLGRAVLGVGS